MAPLDLSVRDNSLAISAIESMSTKHRKYSVVECSPVQTMKNSRLKRKISKFEEPPEERILLDHTKDQPDVIMKHLLQGKCYSECEQRILAKWIHTLPQEDRMQIEVDKKYFPIPRNINQKDIKVGLKLIYGVGKNRRLRPGEEALIMETIRRYLDNSLINPQLLNSGVQNTLQQIMKLSGLEDINEHPFCMKQLECHWKMMITRFRYSGHPGLRSKKMQRFLEIAQQRGHVLDLTKQDGLVSYLLKYSKVSDDVL